MINGIVVGLVIDNKDPDKLARIKVKYPVDHESPPESTWVRMMWPMSGPKRGWVIIPDIGTEVVIGFAYQSTGSFVGPLIYIGVVALLGAFSYSVILGDIHRLELEK